jgi:pilus assembly protein CpaE
MLDSLSIKNTKLGLETLELMECDTSAATLVLNRADSDVGITRADVADVIGREPDVLIPSDRAVPRSINEGTPIVIGKPSSPVARAIGKLAARYTPFEVNANGHPPEAADRAGVRLRLPFLRRRAA